ncbi:Kelch repeat-containing protein [Pseudomonas sp. NFX224]|uniref:Kelch repeat-containing protein n=1 Tax=Pseudomonas sp. NFX224 TaxID=3402862 RepID=UPI003AFAC306
MPNLIIPAIFATLFVTASGSTFAQGERETTALPHWSRAADAGLARQEIYPVEFDGKIYVAGGLQTPAPGFTAYFEAFDAKLNRWSKLAPLPEARHHIALAETGGLIYGIGGFSGAYPDWQMHSSVFIYNPKNNRWSDGPGMPHPHAEGVVEAVQGKVYSLGGRSAMKPDAKHFRDYEDTVQSDVLDPSTQQWHRIADAPSARNSAGGAVIDGKIYVVGGRTVVRQADGNLSQVNVATLEVYDPATNTWTIRTPMPQAQGAPAAATYAGKLYVFGGEQWVPEKKAFAEGWIYDPAKDTWSALPALPTPRHGLGAGVVANRIYFIDGATQPGANEPSKLNEVLELQPSR